MLEDDKVCRRGVVEAGQQREVAELRSDRRASLAAPNPRKP